MSCLLSHNYELRVGEFDIDGGTEFVGTVGDVILWHNFLVRAQPAFILFAAAALCGIEPMDSCLAKVLLRLFYMNHCATITQIHGSSTNARRKPRLGVFSRWHHADMYLPQPVEPPDFEVCPVASVDPSFSIYGPSDERWDCACMSQPLGSPAREQEKRYYTPVDLWEMWSDECRAASAPRL